jgi:hypothetical protein
MVVMVSSPSLPQPRTCSTPRLSRASIQYHASPPRFTAIPTIIIQLFIVERRKPSSGSKLIFRTTDSPTSSSSRSPTLSTSCESTVFARADQLISVPEAILTPGRPIRQVFWLDSTKPLVFPMAKEDTPSLPMGRIGKSPNA